MICFTIDQVQWVTLAEDDGMPKAKWGVRAIPFAVFQDLEDRSMRRYLGRPATVEGEKVDPLSRLDDARTDRDLIREWVQWGIAAHEGISDAKGTPIACERAKAAAGGQEWDVVADRTLEVYERTRIGDATLLTLLALKVQEAQRLTVADRRALPGADLAGS